MDETQRPTQQTAETFFEKWSKNPDPAFSETLREGSDIFDWILTRNGFSSPQQLQIHLQSRKRILDAGCGNGRVTALLDRYADAGAQIVGIDL